jgi:signal transduction histidine kinase
MITKPANPVHFLLVDDLESNLLALEALLRRERLVLLKAQSGTDALELLLKHEVALALIDIQMPGMDGFELAELMRGSERTRRVPIIFLTAGSADRQRRFRGYEAGAVDFLQKPVEHEILRSKADVFFELYSQRDELRVATEENTRLLKESRQYAAALEEAGRRKDEFLAMLAHELRNPLAAISNATQVSKRATGDEHHQWATQVIEGQVKNLSRLIDDLLDVSRITRGTIQLQRQVLDVRPVIERAIDSVTLLIQAREHRLSVEYGHGDRRVDVDPMRLEQIAANLLNNAAKYTEDRGHIQISTAIEGEELVVAITDTGLGIPPEQLSEMFELFVQGNRAMARSEGGLGIGLTIVRRLVEMHGGSVTATSEGSGLGSTFKVRLPLVREAPRTVASGDAPISEPTANAARARILVVDDNLDTASGLARLLSLRGHEVRSAGDGKEALAIADRFAFDFILLDIGLPGMDGYELLRTLRARERCMDVVMVAISGYGQEADLRRSREAGFDHHLVKPVDHAALMAIVAGE